MRDLRTGLNIKAMEELSEEASRLIRLKAESIFSGLEILYRLAPAERGEELGHTLDLLDDLILSLGDATAIDADTALFVHAAALRVCLAPKADPPALIIPPSRSHQG